MSRTEIARQRLVGFCLQVLDCLPLSLEKLLGTSGAPQCCYFRGLGSLNSVFQTGVPESISIDVPSVAGFS